MLKKAALAAVAVVVLLVVVGLALPRTWRVERSVVIDAPSHRIHPFLNDLRRWQEWAVWNKELDPQVRNTWEGPQDGVGSKWAWMGPQMGRGRMEIVASDPATGLTLDEAIESDEVNAKSVFTYAAVGASTKVTWVDEGTLPPVIGGYFRGMVEEMLGGHFDRGLQKLKALVEALPPPPPNVVTPPPVAPAPDAGADDAGSPPAPDADAGA
jgi:hypothetical protein